ncbi:hypothetical protein BX286_4225 [Streptomyces sp. 3211.6]|uniref:hypothetical protein n=1 Tax=Streptomyces sp. 3211.6 TaxID=1938845 RepID=UPI000EB2F496|nr:hypothetical protein [Streptomyces sp. 3211.6]RKT06187.1 hypothetical protein BX286_4225 [Streptomyces sp. 3211.6]
MLSGRVRRVRFGAVLVAVVLSLTGFSTGGGHGKSDGGGGGCSSSKSKSKSRTTKTSQGAGTRTDSGPAATASPTASTGPATAYVVSCIDAGTARPSSTIEVTSRLDRTATFSVTLRREGVGAGLIETSTVLVTLEPRRTAREVVPLRAEDRAEDVKDCRITGITTAPATVSPSPTPTSPTPTPTSAAARKP